MVYNRNPFSKLSTMIYEHEILRKKAINLLASENIASPLVKKVMTSDLMGRYSSTFYGGTKINRKIIEYTENIAQELFDAEFSCVVPVSGHLCDLASLLSFTNVNDNVAIVNSKDGGYPFNIEPFNRNLVNIPFNNKIYDFKYQKLSEFFDCYKPTLSIIGSSVIPFPYKLDKILSSSNIHNQIVYDGSHVLGLIAGGKFQNPLKEGVSTLIGSTHKSLPGPQGGIILSNDSDSFNKIISTFSIQSHDDPFEAGNGTVLVDNVHSNRIAALGISLIEMLNFGKEYAEQTIKNSNVLGNELKNHGFNVLENQEHGISKSHQILLPYKDNEGKIIKEKLERHNILVDNFVRIGTAELTRKNYKESEMRYIAELINDVINNDITTNIDRKIFDLTSEFQDIVFGFSDIEEIDF